MGELNFTKSLIIALCEGRYVWHRPVWHVREMAFRFPPALDQGEVDQTRSGARAPRACRLREQQMPSESGPLRAVHFSRHKWTTLVGKLAQHKWTTLTLVTT